LPVSDRDYTHDKHPPYCNCYKCTQERLSRLKLERSDKKLRKFNRSYEKIQRNLLKNIHDKDDGISPRDTVIDITKYLSSIFLPLLIIGAAVYFIVKYQLWSYL